VARGLVVLTTTPLLMMPFLFFLRSEFNKPIPPEKIKLWVILSALSWLFLFVTDVYYVLDSRRKTMYRQSSVMGIKWDSAGINFNDILLVAVTGYRDVANNQMIVWHYSVVVVLKSSEIMRLSGLSKDYDRCRAAAVMMAEFLDVEYKPSEPEHSLFVICEKETGELFTGFNQAFVPSPEISTEMPILSVLGSIGVLIFLKLILP
jgi:hypothetical protein